MKLFPITVTKIKPFEAHFRRSPSTEPSDILTKRNKSRLSYNKIRSLASDKSKLKQPIFHRESGHRL